MQRSRGISVGVLLLIVGLVALLLGVLWSAGKWRPHRPAPPSRSARTTPLITPVQARGELKLLASFTGDLGEEGQPLRFQGERLREVGVAAVAWGVPYTDRVPDEIMLQVPALEPDTPVPPPPPPELEPLDERDLEVCPRAAGAHLAAALYGKATVEAPCILEIRLGRRDAPAAVRRRLADRVELWQFCALVIYGEGRGLLALVVGSTVREPRGRHVLRQVMYAVEAPDWEPQVLGDFHTRPEGEQMIVGRTVDGGTVYVLSDTMEGNGTFGNDLWRIDTESKLVTCVCHASDGLGQYVIPSPDGTLLAAGWGPYWIPSYSAWTANPLKLVDCRDGSVHILAWRDVGNHSFGPLAWSADVPGRLYFTDFGGYIWQLDIDPALLAGGGEGTSR